MSAVLHDPALLGRLSSFDTPTLANALGSLTDRPATEGFTRPPVQAVTTSLPPIVGAAVTVAIRSATLFADAAAERRAMLPLYDVVRTIDGPKVVVVQDLDQGPGCLWGEVNATICQALGCQGAVTDGLVRDVPDVEALGFHYLARGVGVARAYTDVVDTAVPLRVGGVEFRHGDLVHADRHGALVIPHDVAEALPAAAERVIDRERRLLDWVRSDEFDPDELEARRAQH